MLPRDNDFRTENLNSLLDRWDDRADGTVPHAGRAYESTCSRKEIT